MCESSCVWSYVMYTSYTRNILHKNHDCVLLWFEEISILSFQRIFNKLNVFKMIAKH